MYPFNLKRNFKKISILIAIPYIILCITSGGLHSLDKRAYHGHCHDNNGSKSKNINHVEHNQDNNNSVSFCFNDHSTDNCGICKWLKSTPKKVHFDQRYSALFQDCSKLCIFDQTIYDFLKYYTHTPRSPPFSLS